MYIRVCKICGKEFSSRSSRAFYCKPCGVEHHRIMARERARLKSGIVTPDTWNITGSMQRLYDISKYGVDYHEAKKKCEVDRLDKGKIKKIP
ncbi:MAG: hypothetical protein ACI4JB_07400 [Porcipelethomonas sp.]